MTSRIAICDSQNYEVMLRLSRAAAIPAFSALGIDWLQPFLAQWQGLVTPESEAGPGWIVPKNRAARLLPGSRRTLGNGDFPGETSTL